MKYKEVKIFDKEGYPEPYPDYDIYSVSYGKYDNTITIKLFPENVNEYCHVVNYELDDEFISYIDLSRTTYTDFKQYESNNYFRRYRFHGKHNIKSIETHRGFLYVFTSNYILISYYMPDKEITRIEIDGVPQDLSDVNLESSYNMVEEALKHLPELERTVQYIEENIVPKALELLG